MVEVLLYYFSGKIKYCDQNTGYGPRTNLEAAKINSDNVGEKYFVFTEHLNLQVYYFIHGSIFELV